MTKIDIFSGFLGAGKTTLIKKLIQEAYNGEKLVLIENEFGEIGVDGGFLKDSGIEITEMNSGCICCSLVGDFGKSLKEVITKYNPDRVIIEPSGVGKLSDVIKAVENVDLTNIENSEVKVNNFVTVCDATKFKMYMKNFKEFFADQLKSAKTIILSRTQKMSQNKLEETVELVKEVNSKANLITTAWDDINGKSILDAMEKSNEFEEELLKEASSKEEHHHHHDEECSCNHEHHHHDEECSCNHEHHHHHDEECGCNHEHHHHHADDVFKSIGIETVHKYTKEQLDKILKELSSTKNYGTILRSKGILPTEGKEWLYFDLVPEEYEVRTGNADVTGKICVIGTDLKEDEIKKLFMC
ncbi:CobW family GTP-binding protein [Clostridium sp. HCP1S3_B4]|uniref:CobW family GTP-binding protein n=1 Tax=unclassified Clostridium TaxID=2614128 RepID=UPI0016A23F2F|nr:GTP-binding protein [Clostridiales bacterium]MDY2730414.1 CobW family GTP-binding protein [Clostridium sp.]NLK22815.1 GTP-binding protein [Clostridiales bacterium]